MVFTFSLQFIYCALVRCWIILFVDLCCFSVDFIFVAFILLLFTLQIVFEFRKIKHLKNKLTFWKWKFYPWKNWASPQNLWADLDLPFCIILWTMKLMPCKMDITPKHHKYRESITSRASNHSEVVLFSESSIPRFLDAFRREAFLIVTSIL